MSLKTLLREGPAVKNIGLEVFFNALTAQRVPVCTSRWLPDHAPASLYLKVMELTRSETIMSSIKKANDETIRRLSTSQPVLYGIGLAKEEIVGMTGKILLHAGPPIEWRRMSGPMRGAVTGAILYEGWAVNVEEAQRIAESGEIRFEPCHHHKAVGPMAGVVSPNMPVFIIKNETFGNLAYATMNEGLGQVLRMGSFSEKVLSHLHWMREVLYPAINSALQFLRNRNKAVNLKSVIAQALHMGDEMHNRNKAGTSLFIRQIAPALVESSQNGRQTAEVLRFIDSNDHFFLNLAMAAGKVCLDACEGIPYSSIVNTMARNGTDFGIRLSCFPNRWFTCPAVLPEVLLFPGFTRDDVNPDIGDSAVMETYGIGGFALAAAPAIVQFVGGSPQDAARYTLEMYTICHAENRDYTIPALQFRGTPTGIDLLQVLQKNTTPVLDTGAACKEAGRGQVGAGIVRMPSEAFIKAAEAFVDHYAEVSV
jgi:hypothetical protein